MARKKSNHVVPTSGEKGWAVKKSGASRASKTFETKQKAVDYGIEISKREKAELYIHKKDGVIQNKNSYGNDPMPPKDTK